MPKFYAVKKGRVPGIYTTWEACQKQIKGFSGAVFKAFIDKQEALNFLGITTPKEAEKPKKRTIGFAYPGKDSEDEADEKMSNLDILDTEKDTVKSVYDYYIYTDGSCLYPEIRKGEKISGPGGYAAIIIPQDGSPVVKLSGGEPDTTNNRMEIKAAIEGLKRIEDGKSILLFTDSKYLKNGIESWLELWKSQNWERKNHAPILNLELWKELDREVSRVQLHLVWVRGHTGDPYNETCDQMAKAEAIKLDTPHS